MSNKAER